MNGVHDMGGMDGFGSVEPEPDEPMLHHAWEGRVLTMVRTLGAAGAFNIDASRFYREMLAPDVYLASSYYQKWLYGLEDMLVAKGFVTADELRDGHASNPPQPLPRAVVTPDQVDRVMVRGAFERAAPAPAQFAIGDRVVARNIHPATHTRLPRYVRGHAGVVERVHGCHVFPDTVAHDKGEQPQWLYTVVFTGAELWGEDGDPTLKVSVEAFEPYLVPAP